MVQLNYVSMKENAIEEIKMTQREIKMLHWYLLVCSENGKVKILQRFHLLWWWVEEWASSVELANLTREGAKENKSGWLTFK